MFKEDTAEVIRALNETPMQWKNTVPKHHTGSSENKTDKTSHFKKRAEMFDASNLGKKDFVLYTPEGGRIMHAIILQVNPQERTITMFAEDGNVYTESLYREHLKRDLVKISANQMSSKKLIPMLWYATAYDKQYNLEKQMMENQKLMCDIEKDMQERY